MITNLFWAFIYNLIGIPLAAGLLYGLTGYFLPPYLAAVFMATSSVSVVTNALFLKRFEPKTEQQLEEERLLLEEKVIDPICGMEIVPSQSIEYKYKGDKYYFCSSLCEVEFKQDPEKYKDFDNIDPKLMHVIKEDLDEGELVIDPVCGMKGKPEDWIEHEHKGEKYYFCNPSCLQEFKETPEKFIKKEENKELKEKTKIEDDKKMGNLECTNCGVKLELPQHCGKPMHKEGDQLVCWMGPECGSQPIPEHCGAPMDVKE
jgi:YHS domain-containing protein